MNQALRSIGRPTDSELNFPSRASSRDAITIPDPHPGPPAFRLYDSSFPDWRHGLSPRPACKSPAPMKVTELLGEPDVMLGISAKGKRSVLARMAARLGEKAGTGEDPALAAMLRRERLGSTAIGHGVAIPHARLDGISTPAAMIATLRNPVSFDAPDDHPVDLLLAVLWPKSDSAGFLPALAGSCRLLRHPELRDRIRASDTPAEAFAWMRYFEGTAMEPSAATPTRQASRTY